MRTGLPFVENRFFPMRIDLQGVLCKPYRVWVHSVVWVPMTTTQNISVRFLSL